MKKVGLRLSGTCGEHLIPVRALLIHELQSVAELAARLLRPRNDVHCILANAAQIAQVPGRKTDVKDCVWIAQLLEHGLIRASLVPPAPIRELRDLARHRKVLIQERTRHANRLHKVLEDAGIKLASVASRLLGASGRAMLVTVYHLLARRTTYLDPGTDYYDRRHAERVRRRAIQTLERQGDRVMLEPAA